MSAIRRAALLAAVLTLPVLSLVDAASPQAASWSPHETPNRINALAVSQGNSTLAAVLALTTVDCVPPACTSPTAPDVAAPDLRIFDVATGYAARTSDNNARVPQGRSHVVVSEDGRTIATLGRDTSQVTGADNVLKLTYYRRAATENWTAATTVLGYVFGSGATAVGLAMSIDGDRVAVLTQEGDTLVTHGFIYKQSALESKFRFPVVGIATGLAGDGKLDRLAVTASIAAPIGRQGIVNTVAWSSGTQQARHAEPAPSNITAVAMSADGTRIAAAVDTGDVLIFRESLASVERLRVGSSPAERVTVSADGRRVAATSGPTLRAYGVAGATSTEEWSTSLVSNVSSMRYNATGAILVVGVPVGSGGAFGFDGQGNQLWRFTGAARAVAINANATFTAYALDNRIFSYTLTRNLTFTFPDGATHAATRVAPLGGSVTYDLTVGNPGSIPEDVAFSATKKADMDIRFEPATLRLTPDETKTIKVTVTPGPGLAGTHSVPILATSPTNGLVRTVAANFTIAPVVSVRLETNLTQVTSEAGVPHSTLIVVRNKGTNDASMSFRAEQSVAGRRWTVEVDPPSLSLAPDAVTTIRLTVTPPANVANGTTNAVTLFLEGENIGDQARIEYRINPNFGIELAPAARTKFVLPGESATYNLTVTNTGSSPATFESYWDVNETSGRAWSVDMPTAPFRLDAGASRTITARVVAPADAIPPDQLVFTITARLVPEGNETAHRESVTLFAKAAAAIIPTPSDEENGIPAPGLLVFASVIALAALLRRRRAE